jgi:hypothetical protein
MKTLTWICLVAFLSPLNLMAQDPNALRKERDKLAERGMWREALNLYGEKLMPISDEKSDLDLRMAVEVIRGQNVWGEFDELIERAIAIHPDNAMLLVQAAASYHSAPHSGRLVAGEFERGGGPRYGRSSMGPDEVPEASAGSWVNTFYRDQVRSFQIFREAVGKSKAMGAPGTALTDDQRELIQSNLAEIAAEFHDAVLSRGRAIPAEAMEGQTFSGKQAQRHNLAGMVPDRAEAMRRLKVYHAAVDTKSRVMTTALEDQLLEARTQVDDLTRDHQAQTELLNEASTHVESLRGEVELLAAEIDTLKAECDEAKIQSANLIAQRDSAGTHLVTLQSRVTELEASQVNFDRKLQLEVARVVASTGTTMPARVTPAGDTTQAADLHSRFAAITDPAEQTVFWRKLTPEQQALILKHQA